MRYFHEQFFQPVHILLCKAEAHGKDSVRFETTILSPFKRFGGPSFVDYMRPRRRHPDGARRKNKR